MQDPLIGRRLLPRYLTHLQVLRLLRLHSPPVPFR